MQKRQVGMSKDLSDSHEMPNMTPPRPGTGAGRGGKRTSVSRTLRADHQELPYIVGESARMEEIYTVIRKAASWDANVCIEGENGTGKELVARALHFSGPRRDNPFVTLDCSTIAEGLIESHLFGHVKGAFTGAVASRQGVFAQAHTGTVFIDEITELASHLQAKLLRVIQTGEFTMVGGNHPQRVNVRIITATNRDLRQAVAKGVFREDLYFRIAVVHIVIPPLRDRREDIPLLAAHFLRSFIASSNQQNTRGLTSRAMTALVNYPWPGNIRQLKNWIEQALVLADGDTIDLQHFPSLTREASEALRPAAPLAPLGLRLEELERWYVLETLRRADGNRTKAARQLGISLRGLQYKLRRYGTDRAGPEPEAGGRYASRGGFEPEPGGRGGFGTRSQWNERPGASLNG
ncbi:MAG TPA: sigma-54 dependent transcriptional regulator [Methylomirabilota bacterium]|nr:sigma-54 dependent transcriptional regulator [Methylomirabilota bacterium]